MKHTVTTLSALPPTLPPVSNPSQHQHPVSSCWQLLLLVLLNLTTLQLHARDESQAWRADDTLATPAWLSISGEQRTRYSYLANQFRSGLDENDQAISLRTLLRVDVRVDTGIKLVTELQDSRAYLTDENSAASTIVVNAAELLQGHLALQVKDAFNTGDTLDLQLGRFTMDLGGRRLVARNRFRNTIQNYSGIYADWQSNKRTRLRTFFTLPVSTLPSDRDGILSNQVKFDEENSDLLFWGIFLDRKQAFFGDNLEVYLFGLHESDGPDDNATRNRELYTQGVRILQPPAQGKWDYELENVLQFGQRRATTNPNDTEDLDVFARFHHAALGYSFNSAWRWRLSAELDYATGDDFASNDNANRFDSLFGPRRTEFGPTGIYGILGRENIISAGLRLRLQPDSRLDGYISWRANWLDEKTDTFARSGTRDPAGLSGSFGGHQIEFRGRYWVIPRQLRYELGAVVFFEGRFLREAPNATDFGDPVFVYTDLTLFF